MPQQAAGTGIVHDGVVDFTMEEAGGSLKALKKIKKKKKKRKEGRERIGGTVGEDDMEMMEVEGMSSGREYMLGFEGKTQRRRKRLA